jgi:uncharacterized protein (TIGR02284 family)
MLPTDESAWFQELHRAFDRRAGASGFRDFPRLAGGEGESQIQSPDPVWPHFDPPPGSIGAGNSTKQEPSKQRNEMPNPSSTLQELESTLRLVIETLIDGQEGLQKIGDDLKDETLKRYFLAESLRRAQFRGELEAVLHQEGIHDVNESGTASGTVHRVWANLKAKLGGGDHTLLATAEEGEDEAKAAYEDALKKELPFPIRQILATQAAHIATSHDYVKAARDGSV